MKFGNQFVNIVIGIPQYFGSHVAFQNRLIIRAFLIIRLQHHIPHAHLFHRGKFAVPHGKRGIPPIMARIMRGVFPHHEFIRNRRPFFHIIRSVRIIVLRFVAVRSKAIHVDRRKADHHVVFRYTRGVDHAKISVARLFGGRVRRPLIGKHHHLQITFDPLFPRKLLHSAGKSVDEADHHARVGVFFGIGDTALAQTRTGKIVVLPEHVIIVPVFIVFHHFRHAFDRHADRGFALRAVFVHGFRFKRTVVVDAVGIAKIGDILRTVAEIRLFYDVFSVVGEGFRIHGIDIAVLHVFFHFHPLQRIMRIVALPPFQISARSVG